MPVHTFQETCLHRKVFNYTCAKVLLVNLENAFLGHKCIYAIGPLVFVEIEKCQYCMEKHVLINYKKSTFW